MQDNGVTKHPLLTVALIYILTGTSIYGAMRGVTPAALAKRLCADASAVGSLVEMDPDELPRVRLEGVINVVTTKPTLSYLQSKHERNSEKMWKAGVRPRFAHADRLDKLPRYEALKLHVSRAERCLLTFYNADEQMLLLPKTFTKQGFEETQQGLHVAMDNKEYLESHEKNIQLVQCSCKHSCGETCEYKSVGLICMEFACQSRANCDNNRGKPKQNQEIGDFNEFQEDEIQRAIEEEEAEEEEAAKAEHEAEKEEAAKAEHEPEEDDLDAESLLSALLPSTFAEAEQDHSDQDDVDAEEWKIEKKQRNAALDHSGPASSKPAKKRKREGPKTKKAKAPAGAQAQRLGQKRALETGENVPGQPPAKTQAKAKGKDAKQPDPALPVGLGRWFF
eukprot:g12740.t1